MAKFWRIAVPNIDTIMSITRMSMSTNHSKNKKQNPLTLSRTPLSMSFPNSYFIKALNIR